MDDGEVDFSDHDVFSGSNLVCDSSMETFLDEILKSTHTCTHTHTCNPPGPDKSHTHTCFHTHTQLFASPEEGAASQSPTEPKKQSKKRPLGNREAVRKYREKKKAHAAFLEEQVTHLKALNQQLMKRLQSQAGLEAEVVRLRALLSDVRGRIDAELGCFPYKKPCNAAPGSEKLAECSAQLQAISGGFYLNTVSVPCDVDVPCFHGETNSSQPQQTEKVVHQACDFVSESCQGLGDLTSHGHTLSSDGV